MNKTSVFRTSVQIERRVVIPRPICEALNIKRGDKVEVIVRKVQ